MLPYLRRLPLVILTRYQGPIKVEKVKRFVPICRESPREDRRLGGLRCTRRAEYDGVVSWC